MTDETEATEVLLQSLIAECHQIIHDLVVPAARSSRDHEERRRYLDTAMELLRTGATVGEAVARLRGGVVNQTQHRIIVERVQSAGEGGEG